MTQFLSPRSRVLRSFTIAAGLLMLSGCAMTDPYQRPGVWRPLGSNDANWEMQVARASDLVQGRGTHDVDGDAAAAAVDRLRRDKMKPLPVNGISAVGANATSTGTTAGGS